MYRVGEIEKTCQVFLGKFYSGQEDLNKPDRFNTFISHGLGRANKPVKFTNITDDRTQGNYFNNNIFFVSTLLLLINW